MSRLKLYFFTQWLAISQGGIRVAAWKLSLLGQLLIAIPIVVLVRILQPVILIRFRPLSNRIGQFVGSTEIYLCQCDAGLHQGRILDLFYFERSVPNHFVKRKWQTKLHVYNFVYALYRINKIIPGGPRHVVPMPEIRDLDRYMERSNIHFTFTRAEKQIGQANLLGYGIPKGSPYICFQARDPSYLAEKSGSSSLYDYHNYRDSKIDTYIPAAEALGKIGFYSIRMGAIVNSPVITDNPKIIDYSNLYRDEFMDIYLSAHCNFYLLDTAGMCAVTAAFRRPIVFVNYVPLENVQTWREEILTIPKKHWLTREKRYMTFREILESGAGRFLRTQEYLDMGIELHNNSPEEIAAVALEMEARIRDAWETTSDDEALQHKFWSLFSPSHWNKEFRSRIGTQFLREHRNLLD